MFSSQYFISALFKNQIDYLSDKDRSLFAHSPPALRFNIIGSGMIGMEHIRVTVLEGRAAINGIYDTSARSARVAEAAANELQHPHKVTVYPTLEAACADPNADALIICTPNHTHLAVLKQAIKSQKPILLEKPMATTVEDALEIVNIAKAYSSFIQVGLQYRYKAIYRECYAEAIDRGAIGALKTVTIMEHRLPFLDKVNQWNKFARYSGRHAGGKVLPLF